MTLRARLPLLVALCASASLPVAARSQALRSDTPQLLIGLRYGATRANSPPGSCGCFLLHGLALDAALPLPAQFSGVVEVAGNHASFVPSTARQLSTVTLLAGPRYALHIGSRQAVFAQALFGAVRGFDAEFRRGAGATDTATAFAYSIGGAYQLRLTRSIDLRPVQLEVIQTNLPNGADNRQRNLRFGAGISFRVPLGLSRR